MQSTEAEADLSAVRDSGPGDLARPAPGAAGAPAPILELDGRVIAKNTLLNVAGQLVPMIGVLLAAPYVIRNLGEERSGILGVSLAIMQFSTLFDLGLGRAVRKRLAEALGRGERERISEIAYTTLAAQLAAGSLGAIVLAAITPLLVGSVLQIAPAMHAEARATFLVVAIAIPLTIVVDSLSGLLEAAQRFDLVNAVRVPFILSSALLPLLGVHLGWDLAAITGMQLVATIVFAAASGALCLHVHPELRARPLLVNVRVTRAELRALLSFGGWIIVSNAIAPLLMYLDRLAIGVLISMTAVTAYTAPFEAVTRLSLVPASLAATLFPAFAALAGRARYDLLERYASRAVVYLLVFLGPIVLVIAVFSRTILERWIGAELAEESSLALAILAVGVLVNALAYVPLSLVQARGRPDLSAAFHAIELPIHAVLVWAFVHWWGIPGAALAWTTRVALDAALLFAASRKLSREARAPLAAAAAPLV